MEPDIARGAGGVPVDGGSAGACGRSREGVLVCGADWGGRAWIGIAEGAGRGARGESQQ